MPQPLQAPPPLAPLPFAPDARTQEMIKDKLKKAEELGTLLFTIYSFEVYTLQSSELKLYFLHLFL